MTRAAANTSWCSRACSPRRRLGPPWRIWPAVFLLAASLPADASSVKVEVKAAPGVMASSEKAARVVATASGEATQTPRVVAAETEVPGFAVLNLPRTADWRISLDADGWWAAPRGLETGADNGPIVLWAHRTASVKGRVEVARGLDPPPEITLRFAPSLARGSQETEPALPEGSIGCPLAEHEFSCDLPVGRHDLRLEAPGFAVRYLWDQVLTPGPGKTLHFPTLLPGASVLGTVLHEETHGPAPDAMVVLAPVVAREDSSPQERARFRLRSQETATDDLGVFQISGVPPGRYDLVVTSEGRIPLTVPMIEVSEGAAQVSLPPVLLSRPAPLEVYVTPPLDPDGRPWRVRLLREERGNQLRSVEGSSETVDPGGYWKASSLPAGEYQLLVEDSFDGRWAMERLIVDGHPDPVFLDLPYVAVEGLLRSGDRPVPATLWFGGRFGKSSLRMHADLEGRFAGYLPREGGWPLDIERFDTKGLQRLETVEVEKAAGQSRARVEIDLPDTLVRGRVLGASGEPVAGASLEILDLDERRLEAATLSDADGEFEVSGLRPGSLVVDARYGELTSGSLSFQLEEGVVGPSLELVLRDRKRLTATIESPHGAVAGALVAGVPVLSDPVPVTIEMATSRADGSFDMEIDRSARAIRLLVAAPGFAARAVELSVPDSDQFGVRLSVGPEGGLLRIVLPAPGPSEGPAPGLLTQRGVPLPLYLYTRWSELHGYGSHESGELLLPDMEPGDYTVCVPASEPTAAGATEIECASGFLVASGELTLAPRRD